MERCFLGMEVEAPWPDSFPSGRVLEEKNRHLTLAFLGDVDLPSLLEVMTRFPIPLFTTGVAGRFDRAVFYPPRNSRAAAWHIHILEGREPFFAFYHIIQEWLRTEQIAFRSRFTPHVTIARAPFNPREWRAAFTPLPLCLKSIALFESFSLSEYQVRWRHAFLAPFEEKEHTADLCFLVRGENIRKVYLHALLALAFRFPPLITYGGDENPETFEEVVEQLNKLVTRADGDIGCPFKAISLHGDMKREENQMIQWEMIVDV